MISKGGFLLAKKEIIRKKKNQFFFSFVKLADLDFGGVNDFSVGVKGLGVEAIGFGPMAQNFQEIGNFSGIKSYDMQFFPGTEFFQEGGVGPGGEGPFPVSPCMRAAPGGGRSGLTLQTRGRMANLEAEQSGIWTLQGEDSLSFPTVPSLN